MKLRNILRKEKKEKVLALSQALSIIISTIAFAYIIASTLPVVSAQEEMRCTKDGDGKILVVPEFLSQTQINQWCINNGGAQVCDGGTNVWRFRVIPCPTATSNLPINPQTNVPALTPPTTPATVPTQTPSATQTPTSATGGAGNLAAILFAAKDLFAVKGGSGTGGAEGAAKEAAKEAAKKGPTALEKFFDTKIYKDLKIGGLLKTAGYAAAIYTGVRVIFGLFGASPELSKSLATASSVGYFAGVISGKIGLSKILGSFFSPLAVGLIVGFLVFLFTFKQTRYDLYAFSCSPWDAPTGGKYCEECNKKEDFPCTKYICKSLGQACELENPGTTEELCVWKNRGDVTPPVIQPWTETLTTGYKYFPDNTISPPDRGVRIVPENANNGCVAPFTPIRFGVALNEAAKCKIDFSNKRNFEEMSFFFGGSSTSKYNHSQTINLPSPQALAVENVTIEDSGEFTLYSRCQDANGNVNTANFVFKFCLDEGPDTTPPLIVTTSILNGFPIAFGETSIDLDVFVNEPAECRWSRVDKSYDDMENQMACNTNVLEFNAQMLYQCGTNLTGLNDRTNNDFYFRCLDQPHLKGTVNESDRNANTQSYKFTLVGTQPLVIDSVKPNGTIKDSTDIIKVTLEAKTSAGFKEGAALCSFSETGDEGSYVQFFTTGTHEHSQDLFLPEGDYTFYIRCTDLGGNTDTKTTSFNVESDSEAPVVVRVFREENFLKIITNEKASCVYSTSTQNACNYLSKDGIAMQSVEDNKHQIAWDPDRTFYIKCEDEFGNQPLPNECSIIARPFGK